MKATEKWRAYYAPAGRIRMLAGNPALDMANTLHWRGDALTEFVVDYPSLVEWSEAAQLITPDEKMRLSVKAAPAIHAAQDIHAQWLQLRAALKEWLPSAVGNEIDRLELEKNAQPAKTILRMIEAMSEKTPLSSYFSLSLSEGEISLSLPLLRSANAIWMLINLPPKGIIRQCEADRCGGYFIDQSRAKPRRWCSMDSCGNREKSARHRGVKQG